MPSLGVVALVICVLGLGTQGVPLKLPSVVNANTNPFLMIAYFSLGAFSAGAVLCMVVVGLMIRDNSSVVVVGAVMRHLLTSDRHVATVAESLLQVLWEGRWGLGAALVYTPGKILQLWAVRRVGVGLSTGIVASVNSVVAFVVGVAVLGDRPGDMGTASLGISMLLMGAIGMVNCKPSASAEVTDTKNPEDVATLTIVSPSSQKITRRSSSCIKISMNAEPVPEMTIQSPIASIDWTGILAAVLSGACLGLQGVPFRLGSSAVSSAFSPYATAAVFLLAQGPLTLLTLTLTGCITSRTTAQIQSYQILPTHASPSKTKRRFFEKGDTQIRLAAWGMSAGLIFSFAAIGQVVTVTTFGATVGMPLTQLNLVVAGVWGIAYFREIRHWKSILLFFVSAALAMVGGGVLQAA